MKFKASGTRKNGKAERVREAVETYPTESVKAAVNMASRSDSARKGTFSKVLIEESRSLGEYLILKHTPRGRLKKVS